MNPHRHDLCGPDCRYRVLYEGTQASLSDLAAKQAGVLARYGRLRNTVVNTLKALMPRRFAELETAAKARMSEVDDDVFISYLQWLLSAPDSNDTPAAYAELRTALAEAGVDVSSSDPAEWAKSIRSRLSDPWRDAAANNARNTPGSLRDLFAPTPTQASPGAPRPAAAPVQHHVQGHTPAPASQPAPVPAPQPVTATPPTQAPFNEPRVEPRPEQRDDLLTQRGGFFDDTDEVEEFPLPASSARAHEPVAAPSPTETLVERGVESVAGVSAETHSEAIAAVSTEAPTSVVAEGAAEVAVAIEAAAEEDDAAGEGLVDDFVSPLDEPDDAFVSPLDEADDDFVSPLDGPDEFSPLEDDLDDEPTDSWDDSAFEGFDAPETPAENNLTEPEPPVANPAEESAPLQTPEQLEQPAPADDTHAPDTTSRAVSEFSSSSEVVPDPVGGPRSSLHDLFATEPEPEPAQDGGWTTVPSTPTAPPQPPTSIQPAPAAAPTRIARPAPIRPEVVTATTGIPKRSRRRATKQATLPDLDIPAAVIPPSASEESLAAVDALVAVPRPVFISDLVEQTGSAELVESWQEARRRQAKVISFIGARKRHRLRGSLVIAAGWLREKQFDLQGSWWAEMVTDNAFRGQTMYELAVLLHRVGDQVVSYRINAHHQTMMLRLRTTRGIVGVVVVIGTETQQGGEARAALCHDVEELFRERCELIAVLAISDKELDGVIGALDEEAQARKWRPPCHVVAAHSWEYADGAVTALRHVLG